MAFKSKKVARAYNKRWYYAHREKRILATQLLRSKRKEIAKRNIVEYLKKHPCVDCGEADIIVLDFDHIRGNKKMGISTMVLYGYKWEDILEEIKKCEVVCSNDHRRRTSQRGNHFRSRVH